MLKLLYYHIVGFGDSGTNNALAEDQLVVIEPSLFACNGRGGYFGFAINK
jgi:hypothetical protein